MSQLPADRTVQVEGFDADILVEGWSMEVTPRCIAIMFPPSYWRRIQEDGRVDEQIKNLCVAIDNSIRHVLDKAKEQQ